MAALDAADWTVTIEEQVVLGMKRHVIGQIVLAGTDTYPTAGVPLPAISAFGMLRNLDTLEFTGPVTPTTTSYVERFDRANHKMLLYEEEAAAAGGPLLECDTSEVPGARTWRFRATGW